VQTKKEIFKRFLDQHSSYIKADEVMADLGFVYQVVGRGAYTLATPAKRDAAAVVEAAKALLVKNEPKVSNAIFVPAMELRLFHRGVGLPAWTTKKFLGEALKLGMSSDLKNVRNNAFRNMPHVLSQEGFSVFIESLPAYELKGAMERLPGASVIPPDYLRLDKLFYSYAMYRAVRDSWGMAQLSPIVELAKRGLLLLDRKADEPEVCLCLSA
jgi:hypothetical protein